MFLGGSLLKALLLPQAERIAAAGGYVCPEGMLNGQLGVSRAFGNHTFTDLKQPADSNGIQLGPLTAEPDVTVHDILAEDEFMLVRNPATITASCVRPISLL